MKTRFLLLVCFSAFLIFPSPAFADEAWYQTNLQRVMEENNCQLSAYGGGGEPNYFLLTPEYFVAWCQRKPKKIPGKLVCLDPAGSGDSNAKEGSGRIVACTREYTEVDQEPPSYDLIVLARQDGHEWRACPNFIDLDVYGTHPLWIEKNTKPYGETFSLSQFWVAKSMIEEQEIVASEDPASGHALLYGDFGAGQILYCYQNRWVMSGYH